MNANITRKALIITAIVFFTGAALAFAHGGHGRGRHMMGHGYGSGMMGYGTKGGMMGYDHHMRGFYGNLSEEDAAKLDEAREKFFEETRSLKEQIDEKRFTLHQELNKKDPDTEKLTELQKALSKLESEFDEKALQHRLEIRKLFPDKPMGRGYKGGMGRGYGGYCW
jgi:Spy/CpxP family protein refolding chaperone